MILSFLMAFSIASERLANFSGRSATLLHTSKRRRTMLDKYVDVNINKRMAMRDDLPLTVTHEVRDTCLCLHLQRAARAIARRFDEAMRPFGLTNGQFSLLMALNRPQPPRIGDLAPLLAMDRTTLTANLKPLQRRGLVEVVVDKTDARGRRMQLTEAGRDRLVAALPVWRAAHAEIERALPGLDPERLRADLQALA
jgi:DNA-binding MarR family transcriptional regulator